MEKVFIVDKFNIELKEYQNVIQTKDLPEELQKIVNQVDCFQKKQVSVFDYERDSLSDYYGLQDNVDVTNGFKDENGDLIKEKLDFLLHLGQHSLNEGCDVMIYENNIYLVESHDSDDFMSKHYDEECAYCYGIKLIKSF